MAYQWLPTRIEGVISGTRKVPTSSSSLCRSCNLAESDGMRGSFAGEMLLPGVDFQVVREKVSMRDVLELLGFVPAEIHGYHRALSPHPDRHSLD